MDKVPSPLKQWAAMCGIPPSGDPLSCLDDMDNMFEKLHRSSNAKGTRANQCRQFLHLLESHKCVRDRVGADIKAWTDNTMALKNNSDNNYYEIKKTSTTTDTREIQLPGGDADAPGAAVKTRKRGKDARKKDAITTKVVRIMKSDEDVHATTCDAMEDVQDVVHEDVQDESGPVAMRDVPEDVQDESGPVATCDVHEDVQDESGPVAMRDVPEDVQDDSGPVATCDVHEDVQDYSGPVATRDVPEEEVQDENGPVTTRDVLEEDVQDDSGPVATRDVPEEEVQDENGHVTTRDVHEDVQDVNKHVTTCDVHEEIQCESGHATNHRVFVDLFDRCMEFNVDAFNKLMEYHFNTFNKLMDNNMVAFDKLMDQQSNVLGIIKSMQ
jgi:hypothetical protein